MDSMSRLLPARLTDSEAPDEVEPYRNLYDAAQDFHPWPTRTRPLWTVRPPSTLVADITAIQARHVAAYGPNGRTGGVGLPECDADRDEEVCIEPMSNTNLWHAGEEP